jgi:hypothetical protein
MVMFNPLEFAETNLGRAGWLLALEILGGVALGLVLAELGYASEIALIAVWLTNIITAWFIGKAAAAQGKSQWLYALFSLMPPIAIWMFLKLHGEHSIRRVS